MVPLADTTIYEMEQRGEFPLRFYLTTRCVVWDLAEVEAWIEARRYASKAKSLTLAPSPMCISARLDPSNTRIRHEYVHRLRIESGRVFLARDPRVDQIGPLLHHVAPLMLVFRLVINSA